jgi:myo-inositol 2-dehydrogenase/D-chiro-inositol 1-dehydrogenase
MTIVGTKGALEIGKAVPRLPLTVETDGARSTAGQVDFFERFGDAFLNEANAFVDAVLGGKPTPSGVEDARAATAMACAMREALKVGG